MDIGELYNFLFGTYAGIGILVGIGLVLSVLISVFWEWRTRRLFKNHEKTEDDWSFFDDDDEDSEEEGK